MGRRKELLTLLRPEPPLSLRLGDVLLHAPEKGGQRAARAHLTRNGSVVAAYVPTRGRHVDWRPAGRAEDEANLDREGGPGAHARSRPDRGYGFAQLGSA